ncbi:MAG: VanZ family protein [Oscillospiraceae bacterium]|nr:VanZ family protein [Oscillospiraceae bacterium]
MKRKKLLSLLIALTLVFIWSNSLLSRELSGAISDTIMETMNDVAAMLGFREDVFTYMMDQDGDGQEEPTSFLVRKAAHITEFAVLAVLVWLRLESRGKKRFFTAAALGAAAGAIDEGLQLLSCRGSQVQDVLIDCIGVLLGLVLTAGIDALRRRRKAKTASS